MALLSHSSDVSGLCGFTAVGVGIGEAKINEVPPETSWKLCVYVSNRTNCGLCSWIQYQRYPEMAILTRQGNTTVSIVVHCMFA